MHCIGELIEPIAKWCGLRDTARARAWRAARHRRHHAVGADGDDAVRCRTAGSAARRAAPARRPAWPATMLPTKARSCGASRREARRLVAAPDDDVGGGLDLVDLVAVDDLLVAGEVEHAANRPRAAPGRSRTAPRCRARRRPASQSRSPGSRSACRSGPSARPARPARAARTGRTSRPSPARWWRPGPASRSTQAPVSARPSIASLVPSVLGA